MSLFTSRDVMVTVVAEDEVGAISWGDVDAGEAAADPPTCTRCTNKTKTTKKTKSAARELALLKAQLRSSR